MSGLPSHWLEVLDSAQRELRSRRGWSEDELGQHLYQRHFARWTAPEEARAFVSGDPVFVEEAVQRAGGAAMWEPGWELIQDAGEWCFVHSGRMRLLVRRSDELWPRRAEVKSTVAVKMPCLREGLMPSFLYWFSRAGAIDPAAPHVRIYLNADANEGLALLEAMLDSRPFERLRFEAKMPNAPEDFQRCDAVVVYADARDAKKVLAALLRYRRTRRRGWGRQTPFAAFTVSPGVALAESPPLRDGEARSFGLHRSHLVARAVLAAKRAGRDDAQAHVLEAFEREQIDPRAPHGQRLPLSFWKRLHGDKRGG